MADIIIVDDDSDLRALLRAYLVTRGHVVREAPDGSVALSQQKERAPQLVITDILMPDREGIETIIELKRCQPRVRIIAMSGGGVGSAEVYLHAAAGLGVDRTFTKPLDLERLADAAEAICGPAWGVEARDAAPGVTPRRRAPASR